MPENSDYIGASIEDSLAENMLVPREFVYVMMQRIRLLANERCVVKRIQATVWINRWLGDICFVGELVYLSTQPPWGHHLLLEYHNYLLLLRFLRRLDPEALDP